MTNFDRAMEFVFKWEGGYVNDPDDPGRETHWGISARFHPDVDIKNLTKVEAKEIYHKDYWIKSGADKMDWPDCLVHFDTAVNMGIDRANGFKGLADDWRDYIRLRLEYYTKLGKFHLKYLRGWINRVLDLWAVAKGAPVEHPLSEEYKP